jgi:hypothetical protein
LPDPTILGIAVQYLDLSQKRPSLKPIHRQ